MIKFEELSDIDTDTDTGKVLFAALGILTSLDIDDIKSHKFGGNSYINDVVKEATRIANKVFYVEEYLLEEARKNRNNKINDLLKDEN